jgi:hypothetical protein
MEFFLNQVADVGTRITWTDKRYRRFLLEITHLFDFKGEINNSWGMYALYIHSNGRTIKEFIERLAQYGINVDSTDRNITAFPNPFQYNITFNGDRYSTQPVIQKKFKDIKYIKLESVTMPDLYSMTKLELTLNSDYNTIHTYLNTNYTTLKNNDSFSLVLVAGSTVVTICSTYVISTKWTINYILNQDPTYVFEMDQSNTYNKYYINTTKRIFNDRMFYIHIPEIVSQTYTTCHQDKITFIVTIVGVNNYTLLTEVHPPFLWYKDSMLQNANKYTVKITDRYGSVYNVGNLDKNANLDNCDCSDTVDYSCRCSYIRNPYYIKLQVNLQFKLGVFEDDLAKPLLNVHPTQG